MKTTRTVTVTSRLRGPLLVAYALSGCAALVYEVAWTRLLAQLLGQSAAAVSTVLAAFMGGLGAGAMMGAALAVRNSAARSLTIYALLEILIAGWALLMPAALAAVTPLLATTYGEGGGFGFAAARLGATLLLLLVPTAAMGATYPIAVRAVDTAHRPGSAAGALYAANVAGACAGAALAGFVLLPHLGLFRTSLFSVFLNVLAAAIAMHLAKQMKDTGVEAPDITAKAALSRASPAQTRQARSAQPPQSALVSSTVLAAAALTLTGFVALVNEVAWTRVLALTIGPTTYAFSAMLSLFILGLAIGSGASARLAPRVRHPMSALGIVLMLAGVAALAAMPQVNALSLRVADLMRSSNPSYAGVLRAQAGVWAGLLLPIAAAFGAAFPLALRAGVGEEGRVPRKVAVLYGMNTAGAIAGSLAAGFLLVPALGLQRTIQVAALLVMAGGFLLLLIARIRTLMIVGAAAMLIVAGALAWSAARWDAALLSAGAYKYARSLPLPDLESALRAGSLLYYRDGASATVSVRRASGVLSLAIDGKVDASDAGDMQTQKLLAHVPLMLHAQPRRVAIVGLGSGVTLGAALRHPIDLVDTIEISPEVVEASTFFSEQNQHAMADPRSRLVLGDGRTHLRLSPGSYDVIVSEPSNPWMAGIASLFTREFFLIARRALTSDGILCQWAHTYDISRADLRSIVATFRSVFPDGTIWLVGQGDVLLIGSPAGIIGRLPTIEASHRRPGVAADLAEVAVADAASVLATYAGGPAELEAYSDGAIVQTDDRTGLEFSAPHAILGVGEDNAAVLRRLAGSERLPPIVAASRAPADAAGWRNRGRMHLAADAYALGYEAFERAVTLDPDDQSSVDGLIEAASAANRAEPAMSLLRGLAQSNPQSIAVHVGLSRLLASAGDAAGALEQVVPLAAKRADDPGPAEQAAAVLADIGDAARLRPIAEHLIKQWPGRSSGAYYAGTAAFLDGRPEDAVRLARDGLGAHPKEARLQTLVGAASASLGRRDEARAAFEAALTLSPRDPVPYTNLGLLDLEAGASSSAIGRFAEALILDPSSTAALQGLARALRQEGHHDRAARVEAAVSRQRAQ